MASGGNGFAAFACAPARRLFALRAGGRNGGIWIGDRLLNWLGEQAAAQKPMSAGNRNEYRLELVTFANWCVRTGRLSANPFAAVPRADAKSDPKRKRRALTETELTKLLDVARRRPLLDAQMVRRGKRKGEAVADIRPEVAARLERLGWERTLIYKTLVLTGLRKRELASLTIGQLHLDASTPYVDLLAARCARRAARTTGEQTNRSGAGT